MPRPFSLLWLLGALLTLLGGFALLAFIYAPLPYGAAWLFLALLGPALMLLSGTWSLWQAVTLVRHGGGWSGVVTWAGWAWLSGPFLLLGCALWLTRTGDVGFSVSGTGVGWTFYYPSDLTEQWLTAAELLTLWLGPGLALLWWGRRLSRESV